VAGTEVRADAFYEMMDNLSRAMFADRGSRPLGAWTLGPRLANWAAPLKADYVVFTVVRGSIWGSDRSGCRGNFLLPLLRAGLLVVELDSGRIVRFRATKLADVETLHIAAGVGKLMEALDLPTAITN
jgi:hypothetical protein